MALPETTDTALLRKILSVNVRALSERLLHSELLTEDIRTAGEQEYQRLLFLLVKHEGEVIVPTKLMDLYWHEHILDTRTYAHDCRYLLEGVRADACIHHDPRLRPRTPAHMLGVNRRNELYAKYFDGEPVFMNGDEEAGCGGNCA